MSTNTALTAGTKIVIAKGCNARQVAKGTKAVVSAVVALGAEYGHMVKVVIAFPAARMGLPERNIAFYVRHTNRLADAVIGMNDGNPSHRIEVRRA